MYQGRPILLEREQREIYCDNFCHVTSQVSAMLEHESEPKPLKIFSPKRYRQNKITFSISSILTFSFDCKINQQTRQKYVCLLLWLWSRSPWLNWENAVDLLKMYRVILSYVSEELRRLKNVNNLDLKLFLNIKCSLSLK